MPQLTLSKCDVCGGPIQSQNKHGVCQCNPDCGREYQRRYNVARNHEDVHTLTLTDKQLSMLDEAVVVYLQVPKTGHDQMILDDLRCSIAEAVKAKELDDAGGTALDKS